ncbi:MULTISPECIES: hypothetical protein [unclassified Aminobacter]|uniref:hypothetical protein n=1 Tax=unclassified Aminobacter TaxID=2644704 RepID=UPI0004630733|nr:MULTISPECIES: hypothetical protein [unclassified Aminobacter]TWH35598.1 hypothetical protein L611_001200000790 [Aminobacter sp. J15]
MAIKTSGPLMLSEVLAEYKASPSVPRMLSSLYRGGSIVRNNSAGNVAQNMSAGVPTSGPMMVSQFYGQEAAWKLTLGNGTDTYISGQFGTDNADDWKKIIEVVSGAVIGGTTQHGYALTITNLTNGELELINRGEIQGRGGNHTWYSGGHGLGLGVTIPTKVYNYGAIRGGGGRGGNGGQGGQGYYDTSNREPPSGEWYQNNGSDNYYWYYDSSANCDIYWGGPNVAWAGKLSSVSQSTVTVGFITYYRGSFREGAGVGIYSSLHRVVTTRTPVAGGTGGPGGLGRGYNQPRGEGSPGSGGGGHGAGGGGHGNWGGDWGQQGLTGTAGINGTYTNGSPGLAGSPAGVALSHYPSLTTFVVTGTINGLKHEW